MGLSGLAIYAMLHLIFRNNRVSRAEADQSKPARFFGMDVWPKQKEGQVKIPAYALIGLGGWIFISFLIEFTH